jgi:hypothetical protein
MIAAKVSRDGSKDVLLIVLEPGNLAKLQTGNPILKNLREFIPDLPREMDLMIAFSPDTVWVAQQVQNGADLVETLEKSLSRKDNFRTPEASEALRKVEL